MKLKILCLEDNPTIQVLVQESLPDFEVLSVETIKDAEVVLQNEQIEALLLDIQLPDGDGLRFLAQHSADQRFQGLPVLVLSQSTEIANKVLAFSIGAEDFIAKPFDPLELRARVEAKIKKSRQDQQKAKIRMLADLQIDFDRQKAFHITSAREKDLRLTAIEFKILNILTQRMEMVLSREQLLDLVWGDTYISDRTVDSHISHLRQKISPTKVTLEAAKSFGYRAVFKDL